MSARVAGIVIIAFALLLVAQLAGLAGTPADFHNSSAARAEAPVSSAPAESLTTWALTPWALNAEAAAP
ncbi:MAG: hypothetical protein ABWX92_08650 [Mycetocola sp.]